MQQYLTQLEKSWFELHRHYHFSEPQKIFNKAHFYQTESLYQTEYFQQNFEQRARKNLRKVI
ncbi:hypothetical protein F898_02861 [Acinetobacter courvalinii]|nr:hypothetical protein F898_02861 [Acinetobacter courvalinii]